MTSTIDTTILTMLSRYPDIPRSEADEYINQIEHEENIPLCHAVIGRIDPEELVDTLSGVSRQLATNPC